MSQQILTPGFLRWDGFKYILTPGTFTPAGDLSGDAISQTVVGIQGNPIPGPAGTNTVLTWTGSALIWGSGGSGISTIENQGTPIAGGPFSTLNFTGAGVVASNAGGGVATITIAGGLEPPFPLSDIEAGTTGYVAISIDGVSTWTPLTQVIFQTSTLDLNSATPILAETTIQGGPFGGPTTTTLWADPPLGTMINFKYVTGGSPPIWTINSDSNNIDGAPTTTLTSNGQTLVLIYVGGAQGWLSYRNTGSSFTAGGDLSGSSSSQTVIGIQAVAISATAPSTGQVLTATSSTAANWQTPSGGGGNITLGTYASRPSPGTAGALYYPTDGAINFIDNGTAWLPIIDGTLGVQPPAAASFTQGGFQTGTTGVDSHGAVVLTNGSTGGNIIQSMGISITPSTPYTLTVALRSFMWTIANTENANIGIGISNGTLFYVLQAFTFNVPGGIAGNAGAALYVTQYNNRTTVNTSPASGFFNYSGQAHIWMRIKNDGTNRTWQSSVNGIDWYVLFTEGHSTFITESQVFFYLDASFGNTQATQVILDSWSLTFP